MTSPEKKKKKRVTRFKLRSKHIIMNATDQPWKEKEKTGDEV